MKVTDPVAQQTNWA